MMWLGVALIVLAVVIYVVNDDDHGGNGLNGSGGRFAI